MSKAERIEKRIQALAGCTDAESCYRAYFLCFNETKYYEAHDVLEHAWLKLPQEEGGFFKGLIQLAGAFVHLQKQYLRPHHYKFAGRLRPAIQLLRLASKNLQPHAPKHMHLDIASILKSCEIVEKQIAASGYQLNPWRPESAPRFKTHNRFWYLEHLERF